MKILFNKYISKDKLFLTFGSIFMLIAVLSFVFFNINDEKLLSSLNITKADYDNILQSKQQTSKVLVNDVYFNGFKLIKDIDSDSWFYSLIDDSNNAYSPKISFNKISNDIKIASLQKEINPKNIEKNIPIKFIAYNDNEYYLFNVICTTLPILSINEGKIYLFDNRKNSSRREFSSYVDYRERGHYSIHYPKKNFSINLKNYSPGKNRRKVSTTLLGMPEKSKWHLYSAFVDPEKIRQVFSAKLWKDCCSYNNSFWVDNGYEYKSIELFIDNKYWGLYYLGYPLDEKQMKLRTDEYLYKRSSPAEDYKLVAGKFKNFPTIDINKYFSLLKLENTTKNVQELYDKTEIGNAIDFWLFINLIQGVDNFCFEYSTVTNLFVTQKVTNNGTLRFIFTPWDFDGTWGHTFDHPEKEKDFPPKVNSVPKAYEQIFVIYYLLYNNDENIKALIKNRYAELRKTFWKAEYLLSLIDSYEKDIFDSGAYIRDKQRWPKATYMKNEKIKLSDFKKYVLKRLHYMDLYVEEVTKN